MSATRPIRAVVVDDHEMFADALVAALSAEPGIGVAGRAASAAEARDLLARTDDIDIVLMDYRLPDGLGTDLAADVHRRHPLARILLVSALTDDSVLETALRAGCAGYVSKSEPLAQLIAAVRAVHAGATAISPLLLAELMDRRHRDPGGRAQLTDRELAVLKLLAQGDTPPEISAALGISANTLRNHAQRAIVKLGAHSRLEAVTIAVRAGLIDLEAGPDDDSEAGTVSADG
jgi:DNA-binding NarL/FixJ family response regulator